MRKNRNKNGSEASDDVPAYVLGYKEVDMFLSEHATASEIDWQWSVGGSGRLQTGKTLLRPKKFQQF